MQTLNSLIDLSTAALQADQQALNVTANNVANQNTAGYTREVVTFTNNDYVTLSDGALNSTSGPTANVTSARDLSLERQVQAQTQAVSSSSTLSSILSQIETVFGVTGSGSAAGSTQLGSTIDSLFSSLTALTGNPSDSATRQGVLSAAQSVAQAFNSASNQLTQLNTTLGAQATSTVAQVNALTATVAALNLQIAQQSPTADAGTLEDQRQTAITQLSQYVGLSQSTTENNQINLTTTNGTALVVGQTAYDLSTGNVAGETHVFNSQGADITTGLTGGSLGGQLQGLTQQIPSIRSSIDTLAYSLGTQINQQNEAGLDANGNAGQAIFALPASATGTSGFISVIPTSASAIAAASTGEGTSGNANATALANLAQATNTSGQTFDEFYAALISQVGTAAASATSQTTAGQTDLTQLQTQRDAYSVVDLNEEASNLTTYQRSYEAASKVFTIADTILADAINLGVQSAVA